MKLKTGFSLLVFVSFLLTLSIIAAQDVEYAGTVLSKSGAIVKMRLDGAPGLSAGASVSVYKFFTKNILGMDTTGWLLAAEGKLISIKGSVASVRVTEEKSAMVVNGKKVEHLTAGTKIKLVLK